MGCGLGVDSRLQQPPPLQFFFKRYLEFETQHGTEERVEQVKQKAVEFVEKVVGP